MNVLMAIDGSADTKRMPAYLSAHDLLDMVLKNLVLAVLPQVTVQVTHFVSHEVAENYYRTNAKAIFAPVSTFFERHNVRFKTRHVVGIEAKLILKVAKHRGSRNHWVGLAGAAYVGSMWPRFLAQKVLTVIDIPVLVV
jgi:hypothetical protein